MFRWFSTPVTTFIKAHKKGIAGTMLAIVVGGIATMANQFIQTVENNAETLLMLQQLLTKIDTRTNRLEDEIGQTIKQPDWIAYIKRKDDEYHNQQHLNHQLFESIGELKGRQLEDEKILNQLLNRQLNQKGST